MAVNLIRSFSDIPGPVLYPLVGNLYQYVMGPFSKDKYQEALMSLYREYGNLVRQNIGGREIIHVFDPEDIKTVNYTFFSFLRNLF